MTQLTFADHAGLDYLTGRTTVTVEEAAAARATTDTAQAVSPGSGKGGNQLFGLVRSASGALGIFRAFTTQLQSLENLLALEALVLENRHELVSYSSDLVF